MKHSAHLHLVRDERSAQHESVLKAVRIAALDELSSRERKQVENAVHGICDGAGVLGVQVTPRSWDLRPVVSAPGDSSPSLIRFLGPEVTLSRSLTQRVQDQLKRVSKLGIVHGACPVVDWGVFDGQVWYRRPVVEETLESKLENDNQLTLADALLIARKLVTLVESLHSRGVHHGHINTSNIAVTPDVSLIDIGIGLSVVQASRALGLEAFPAGYDKSEFAPETLEGERITAKADIYSLGEVLGELFLRFVRKTSGRVDNNGLRQLAEVFAQMSDSNPAKRPSLRVVQELLGDKQEPEESAQHEAVASAWKRGWRVDSGQSEKANRQN